MSLWMHRQSAHIWSEVCPQAHGGATNTDQCAPWDTDVRKAGVVVDGEAGETLVGVVRLLRRAAELS